MEETKEDRGIIEYETEHGKVKLSPAIVRSFLVNGQGNVTDQEIVLFMNLCRYQQLNPFLRDAYLIKYGDNYDATMVVSKDVFNKRAAKAEDYDGMESGIYVTDKDDKLIKRTGALVLPDEKVAGGWAKLFRKNWGVPVEIAVSYTEYVGLKKDGEVNKQWKSKPATMICKVAKKQAWNEAYPDLMQGLTTAEEMQVDESVLSTKPIDSVRVGLLSDIQGVLADECFNDKERANVEKLTEAVKSNVALKTVKKTWERERESRLDTLKSEKEEVVKEEDYTVAGPESDRLFVEGDVETEGNLSE